MFASGSVTEHLVRGAAGFAALAIALLLMVNGSFWSVPLALGAVALLRGCPTCWTIGLFETVSARSACRDESCANELEQSSRL